MIPIGGRFVGYSFNRRAMTFARTQLGLICFAFAICLPDTAHAVDFEADIASILVARCIECHNERKSSGGLDLSSSVSVSKGGDSGAAIEAGDAAGSYLFQRIRDGEMPPESRGESQKLPDDEIALIEQWIAGGGAWPKNRTLNLYEKTSTVRGGLDWWSLQPVKRPELPDSADQHPIDALIRSRLQHQGMTMSPRADRLALVRRAYIDLLGLPPTPEQVDAFVEDDSADAWEHLIDRLLQSPHYGERWARYWLDVVRFAETNGYERDKLKPSIWKYRDWVIKAFNDDMPYDKFVTQQLAGDEVEDRDQQSVIATGMIRAGTWNDEPNDPADYVYTRLEDFVHTTASAFIGLTVKCARCHDHKFDPIPQTDYYRIAAAFWPGYIGQANLGGPNHEQLGFDVFGWTDRAAKAEPIHLLIKGERHQPGEVVSPGVLSAIPSLDRHFDPPPAAARTTRRRLQLAKWITDRRHPLTARVLVNRLWLHHFGEGIVRTPNNFGFKGSLPTHPKLLDWLASEFVDRGWEIKPLHKLIMMSETYQQASQHPQQDRYFQVDSQNELLWRFNRQRLDAEAMRDSMLAVSGQLNVKMGGPSFYPEISDEALEGLSKKSGDWKASPAEERSRRSIYMMSKRSRLLPLMTSFNFSDTTLPCGQRDETIVAPQSLALLNNRFVHRQSEAMALRVAKQADSVDEQVSIAWRLVFGRLPTEQELDWSRTHLADQLSLFQNKPLSGEITNNGLALWLRADRGVETDAHGGVMFWRDQVSHAGILPHDASQADPSRRPQFVSAGFAGKPVLRFDGKRQFLHVAGQVISTSQFTIIAVANDRSSETGAREIISNWSRQGRSTTSVFLGTRDQGEIRFSDAFAPAGKLREPAKPFILTGICRQSSAQTFQNSRQLSSSASLPNRDLAAPYVIGTQGNYGTEWWDGDVAEVLVYDRALTESECGQAWQLLAKRYEIDLEGNLDAHHLALASLCHVLLNTNEFMYID